MKRSEILFGLLRIPVDFTMVLLGFLLGYKLRLQGDFIPGIQFQLNPNSLLSPNEYFKFSLIFAGMLVAVFAFSDLYKLKNTVSLTHEIRRIFSHSFVWLAVIMAYFFITHEQFFSRLVLGFSVIVTVLLLIISRLILNRLKKLLLKANIGKRRVLLIGGNKISKKIAAVLIKDPRYKIVGFLSLKTTKINKLKRLGSLKNLEKTVKRYKVEELIQTSQNLTELQDHEILKFSQEKHLEYRFVPDILAVERSNIEIEPVAGFPLIHLKPTSLDGWGKVYKRTVDFLASFFGLILLSPLFLIVAILIKLDSKGPVLFNKLSNGKPAYRIGQKGKKFRFYKFRTMQNNTHHLRKTMKAKNHRAGPLMKIKNDPRITKIGSKLRKTSIDELPQLWNVLNGKMSLVGPRPHLPEEVANYKNHHKFLLTIKPGITGLSQISGRSNLDFEEEVKLDSYYIKHWSPLLDFKILMKTIIVVLRGNAAD